MKLMINRNTAPTMQQLAHATVATPPSDVSAISAPITVISQHA
jgi:hypothetical protein